MGRTIKGHRKSRDQKRKKRDQRKRLQRRERAEASSWKARMQRAGRWPLLECQINADFRESGLAQVLFARQGPAGIAIGLFLVDLGCLGVKNCILDDELVQRAYDRLVENLTEREAFEPCDPAFAVKVVQTGVRYAAELGFRPHPDYGAAREVFGDIAHDLCRDEVPCGRDGKPFYVEGPDDDAAEILRRLEERLGPDGFLYVGAPGQLPGDFEAEAFPDETDPDPEERSWGRLRRTEGHLIGAILRYAAAHRGRRFLEQARAEFDPNGVGLGAADGEPEDGAFVPWALFNWIPRRRKGFQGQRGTEARPVALEFLEANEARLDPFERRFLEAICRRPFSFYVIESLEPGKTIGLRDLFSGRTYRVRERRASTVVDVGSVLYARVLPMDSVAILVGCAGLCIPPLFRTKLIDLREELAGENGLLTEEVLRDCDGPFREAYWRIADQIYHPPTPVLQNTDGEPLVLCRVIFDLRCTPQEAFSKLKELALGQTEEDLRKEAAFGANGELESIEIPWIVGGNKVHASWDNTVLGHVEIEGSELVAEVNSEARAGRIRRGIEQRLGDAVVWRTTETESPEKHLAESRRRRARAEPEEAGARTAMELDPAARAQVAQMMASHWESWIDTAIPVLGGRSPREALRTAAGRERLEALLCDMRSHEVRDDLLKPDIESLRRKLGLLG